MKRCVSKGEGRDLYVASFRMLQLLGLTGYNTQYSSRMQFGEGLGDGVCGCGCVVCVTARLGHRKKGLRN